MAPIDKSSSPERPLEREAGGGCPPPSCTYPSTRCNSPNADCSSTVSSCCSSRCGYSQASQRTSSDCQPCVSPVLKSILKKHSCNCQCDTSHCLCQPMPRGCNCPPPVQVDARAIRECCCDSSTNPECVCPPNERRFPKTTVKCPNVPICCPRLSAGPKCHCARCQPCLPSPCDPSCAFTKCRELFPPKNPCPRPRSPCPSCPSCRPVSHPSPCRPPTPCRKLTFCTERNNRPTSSCTRTGQSWREIAGDRNSESDVCNERNNVEERERRYETKDSDSSCDCCCAADYTESENESEHADENCDSIYCEAEDSVENSSSKTFINSSEATNPSRSVGPNSCDASEKKGGSVLENTATTERYTIVKKSSKDSWHTSPIHVPSDNNVKSDRYTFPEERSPVGKNVSGNPVLARLSNRMRSPIRIKQLKDLSASNKLLPRLAIALHDTPRTRVGPLSADVSVSIPTTLTRGIDRRRRNGGFSKEDTIDSNNLSRENHAVRWNISKLSSPTIRDRSVSVSLRSNKDAVSLLPHKSRPFP